MSAIVLIVEDELLLRMNAVQIIEEAGLEVVEASNAHDAISILETRDDIRVVFTDIQMPGSMDGLALAWAVRNRWPPIAIIITSGKVRPAAHEMRRM
ncbi:MAG TPA: response regulator [Rhizomicrobium sp.]|jgi:CheY-like chemotaxis protein|nr:response regulator [Rhizomicrobium sp.]